MEFEIVHYQELSSTNTVLKEMCQKQETHEGTVILADFQTSGRGTSGNTWQADAGKNLLCSILFTPLLEVKHHFSITQFISLALTDTLKELGIEAHIKWPNDIYVGRQKIAGILIENTLKGSKIKNCIVGIGLNINQEAYSTDVPNPLSLRQLLGSESNVRKVLNILLRHCNSRYQMLKNTWYSKLHNAYLDKLFLKGEYIHYLKGPDRLEGTLKGVLETGELEVIDTKGGVNHYLFGEVKILVPDIS